MDEDMILPDDYESQPADEPTVDEQDPVEELDTETAEEPTRDSDETVETTQEEKVETPQTIKLKVDRGEKEVSVEEAAMLAQKGLNYERAVERAAQEARDAYIAEQGHTWNGKAITTEAEYKQALAEQELMNKYQDRDLPPEVIEELMAGRRDREERQKEKEAAAEQAKAAAQLDKFLAYFEQSNGRPYDHVKDAFPQELKDAIDSGTPLMEAYMAHEAKQLRSQLKVAKQNETNSKKAPIGSVTSHGSNETAPEDEFLRGFNSI